MGMEDAEAWGALKGIARARASVQAFAVDFDNPVLKALSPYVLSFRVRGPFLLVAHVLVQ